MTRIWRPGTLALLGLGLAAAVPGLAWGAACTAPSLAWQDQWNGAEGLADEAHGVAVDASGNIFVVGTEQTSAQGLDWKIRKYDSAGNLKAEASYNGPDSFDDTANAVSVDSSGNVWVVGTEFASNAFGSQQDWRMRKYSNDLSSVLTDFSYDYFDALYSPTMDTGLWNDKAWAVAVDGANNIYVGGDVSDWGAVWMWPNTAENYNVMVRKYDPDGNYLASYTRDDLDYRTSIGNNYGYDDTIYSVSLDSSGNVICGGKLEYGIGWSFSYTIKLDSSLAFLGASEITAAGLYDVVHGVGVNLLDNTIIAVGTDDYGGGNLNWGIRKFPPALGPATWSNPYSGAMGGQDEAMAVAVDALGYFVAVGYSMDASLAMDWQIRRYGPNGTFQWNDAFSAADDVAEKATAVAMDDSGFVVAGIVSDGAGNTNWRVAKYAIPACLDAALSVVPSKACVGSGLEVVLTVTNNGQARASSVGATLSLDTGGAAVTLVSGPAAADIPGHTATSFTWVFNATGNGTLALTATAQGTDSSGVVGYIEAVSTGVTAQSVQPASLSSGMTVDPLNVLVGNWFDVVLTVVNTVGSAANGVEATMWIDSGGTLIELIQGPPATPISIPSGGTASFTWTWSASGNGMATFTATATGEDSCGGSTIATDSSGSIVIPGAFILADVAVIPASSCLGKQVEVRMTVTNSGSGNADTVSATLSVDAGEGQLSLFAADEGPYTLASGTSRTYSWTFSVTGISTAQFTATATGMDLSISLPIMVSQTSLPVPLLAPAALKGAISVSPGSLLAGNWVNVVLSVTNTGGVDAQGVAATMWFDSGGGVLELISGPSPAPVTIPAAGSNHFTWTWSASGSGLVSLTATAAGEDSCQGTSLATAYIGSVVVPGVSFESALAVVPPSSCIGNWLDVHLTVTNLGSGNATGVTATLSVDTGGSIVKLVSADEGPLVIGPSLAHTFTWTFSVSGTPVVAFTATAMGMDLSTGVAAITSKTSAAVTLLEPARLEGALSYDPASMLTGNWYTVVLSVTNTGQMDATGVTATMWFTAGGGLSEQINGPPPAPVLMPPGGSQYFTWTWSASGAGVPAFTASATGTDACRGWSVTAGGTGTVTLLGPGRLEGVLGVEPAIQAVGGQVAVILTLTNVGSTDVDGITCTAWIDVGDTFAGLASWPPVGPYTLAGGASQKFTWVFDAWDPGLVQLTVTVTGTEVSGSVPISATFFGQFTVVDVAALCANVAVTPLSAMAGQTVRVVATATNCGPVGGLNVRNVTATPPPVGACPAVPVISVVLGGTATVTPVSAPPATCSLLAPGVSANFTWEYTVGGTGSVDFTVTFSGEQDMTPTAEVTAGASRRLMVSTPSALTASLDLVPACGGPCAAVYGEVITVALDVTNPSSGAADGVYALTQTVTGTARLTLVSAPSERRYLPGYSTIPYIWKYRVDGAGTATFTSQAVGQDFILLNPVISNAATLSLTVPNPPEVDVVVVAPDAAVPGQEITMTVRIRNISSTQVVLSSLGESGDTLGAFTIVSSEPVMPRTLEPGETREFTVKVTVNPAAAVGTAGFSMKAVAQVRWSGEAVLSGGGAVTLALVAAEGDSGGAEPSANPWRAGTGDLSIRYAVVPAQSGYPVSVRIYNLSGELVRTLVDEVQSANVYDVKWDGRNRWGQKVASGIYLILVETRSSRQVRKLAVIR